MSRTLWTSTPVVKKSMTVDVDDEKPDFSYKIVVIGDSGTGKSNIVSQFIDGRFLEFTKTTIGLDFKTRQVRFGDVVIRVQLWDTAGQEQFKSINKSYYRESAGIIIAFDITRRSTFDSISHWINEIKNNLDVDISEVEIMIIGNKTDLEKQRVVSHHDVKKLEEMCNFTYMETCAMKNQGVTEAISTLIRKIHQRGIGNQRSFSRLNINDPNGDKTKDSKCCIIL
jgi:small GTP-binding protein